MLPTAGDRRRALETFSSSPIWKANRDAANATMIDVSDVLLRRPLDGWAFAAPPERPRPGEQRERSTITIIQRSGWGMTLPRPAVDLEVYVDVTLTSGGWVSGRVFSYSTQLGEP